MINSGPFHIKLKTRVGHSTGTEYGIEMEAITHEVSSDTSYLSMKKKKFHLVSKSYTQTEVMLDNSKPPKPRPCEKPLYECHTPWQAS